VNEKAGPKVLKTPARLKEGERFKTVVCSERGATEEVDTVHARTEERGEPYKTRIRGKDRRLAGVRTSGKKRVSG